jgi:hypothetical protein
MATAVEAKGRGATDEPIGERGWMTMLAARTRVFSNLTHQSCGYYRALYV